MTDVGAPAEIVLEVAGLSKSFGATQALSSVDFEVRRGEIHALLGQNGSGKSTLIKLLAGVHQPDHVALARVSGRPFQLGSGRAATAAGMQFVHQDLGLVAELDAVDNFALVAGFECRGRLTIRWRAQAARTRRAIAALGYQFDVRRPVRDLAPSERTAVAIARALSAGPDALSVLVLDEPTASLTSSEANRVHLMMRRATDSGVAVVYVTHHVDDVLEVADRVTVLRDGRHIATRSTTGLGAVELVELIVGQRLSDRGSAPTGARSGTPTLSVEGLSGRVVDGVDLHVYPGEIVGVAGITGSGRSELGPLIFGDHRRRGAVHVDGVPVPSERPDVSVAAGMGYVPADRLGLGLLRDMSVRENLTIARLAPYRAGGRLRHSRERSDVEGWLSRLTIRASSTEARIDTLSGGNQQRVMLARWLRLEPRLLVLDDPTQGVDARAKAEIIQHLRDFASAGGAVLIASSDEDELAALCDRVLILARGRIVGELHTAISAQAISALALTNHLTGADR